MITNVLASIVVSLFTNVHEHQWSPVLKTRVCEVSERTMWTFPGYDIQACVKDERPLFQNTILFSLQNGQWVEATNGRTSGIFLVMPNGDRWYVPHPSVCPPPMR